MSDGKTEDALGREDDERLAVVTHHLAPEEVEVLGGSCDVYKMHVRHECLRESHGLVRELQKALDARAARHGRRMLVGRSRKLGRTSNAQVRQNLDRVKFNRVPTSFKAFKEREDSP